MVIREVIKAIKVALENMDQNYCTLSQIDYAKIDLPKTSLDNLLKEKYLERPFAYEFYYQLRKLIDNGDVDFDGPIIQAEVDKRYQHCFEKGKIPDFIIHIPNSKKNLAVIEFKLATRLKSDIKQDIEKLAKFKTDLQLKYINGVEVILGDMQSLKARGEDISNWNQIGGEEIIIIEFNTDSWKTDHSVLHFKA